MTPPASQEADGKDALAAEEVADSRITLSAVSPLDVKDFRFELFLNNTKDRVGANVSVCGVTGTTTGGKSMNRIMSCQDVVYVFPGLTYDAATQRVLSGTDVVARGGGNEFELEKGFEPQYEIVSRPVDSGFNRDTELYVKLALARASSR
jgi:hypothetical protein